MGKAGPMVSTATRITIAEYDRVVAHSRAEKLFLATGSPNMSATIRDLIVRGLNAGPKQERTREVRGAG